MGKDRRKERRKKRGSQHKVSFMMIGPGHVGGRWSLRTHHTSSNRHWSIAEAEKDESLITKASSLLFTLVKRAWEVLLEGRKATELGTKYHRLLLSHIGGCHTRASSELRVLSSASRLHGPLHRRLYASSDSYLDSTEVRTSAWAWRLKHEGSIHVKN